MLDLYDLTVLWESELGPEGWFGVAKIEYIKNHLGLGSKIICGKRMPVFVESRRYKDTPCTRPDGHPGACKSVRLKLITLKTPNPLTNIDKYKYKVELVDWQTDPEDHPVIPHMIF